MQLIRFIQFLFMLSFSIVLIRNVTAEEPTRLVPQQIELEASPISDGWKQWGDIGDPRAGAVSHRERITALHADQNNVWVGTSRGRLLTQRAEEWILQGHLKGVQITGIAVESPDKVWLSTSDGIRQLEREKDKAWNVREYRHYYEGHPSFVSGAYLPGEDAVRLWGYVDDIYIPTQEKNYAPFAISKEHGLFSWGGYGRVWHHFMPHYWGANSDWLDLRELIPNQRPTCMLKDQSGNLWVSTERDGIVRFNAKSRKYSDRDSDDNQKDGTEFSDFGADEIGCKFDRVVNMAVSKQKGIWAILGSHNAGFHIAHFDGAAWTTIAINKPFSPACLLEVKPGVLLIGDLNYGQQHGLKQLTWQTKQIEEIKGPEHGVREIVQLPNGRVFATSWWGLYEKTKP